MKLETIQTQRGAAMSSAELYSLLKQLSLDYGAGFQGVTEVWRRKGDALGRIRKPAQSSGEYVFDPVLLDSCFHLVAAAQDHDGVEEAFVPVQFDAVDIFGEVPTSSGRVRWFARAVRRVPEW